MTPAPDFSLEQNLLDTASSPCRVIGIDEAGRGPWAGPVVAGAAWVAPEMVAALPHGIDDSKKLGRSRRAALWDALQGMAAENPSQLKIATAMRDAKVIDDTGILPATFAAMQSAALEIHRGFSGAATPLHILVDGTLAPPMTELTAKISTQITPVKKGDGKVISIAIAAIAAKETRDTLMRRLHMQYPAYGWDGNMGYGTAAHAEALKTHGPCPLHRFSFAPVRRARDNQP